MKRFYETGAPDFLFKDDFAAKLLHLKKIKSFIGIQKSNSSSPMIFFEIRIHNLVNEKNSLPLNVEVQSILHHVQKPA